MASRALLRSAAILAVFVIVPACQNEILVGPLFIYTTKTSMDGSQVLPAVAIAATGSATVSVDESYSKVQYSVDVTGVGVVTAVEIRIGEPGQNGPAIFRPTTAPFT